MKNNDEREAEMLKKYQQVTVLDPFAGYVFDDQLQQFIDNYPTPSLTDLFIAEAADLLSLDGGADISRIMAKIGRFVRIAPRGILGCPVYTIVLSNSQLNFRHDLFFIDQMACIDGDESGSGCLSYPFQYAGYNSEFAVLGVDSEYVTDEREIPQDERRGELTTSVRMVSWQFYFSLGIEHVCLVLVTDTRLTQNSLIRQFLANALPDLMTVYQTSHEHRIRQIQISKVYVMAHFALADAGLILPSSDTITKVGPDGLEYSFTCPVIKCEEKQWHDNTWIRERRDIGGLVLVDDNWISEESLKRRTAKRRSTKLK